MLLGLFALLGLHRVLGRLGRGTTHNKEREYAFVNFDLQAGS